MIKPKTKEEIEIMMEGGKKLSQIKKTIRDKVEEGKTPKELDELAEKLILEAGGEPSFKMVKDYHWSTCINVNEGVVHGIPNQKSFKKGDLVSVDLGFFYKWFHTDTSFTIPVGAVSPEVRKFLDTGENALRLATDQVRPGNKVSDMSKAIQKTLESRGYSPVRALTGHGIGRSLHEKPFIPCYWAPGSQDEIIPEGAAFALEVIYTMGSPDLVLSEDGWTIETKDGKISALFEETVVATKDGPLVLTA